MALNQAKLELLTRKVGGRFKLTSLLQKRLVSLIRTRREGTRIPSTAELLDVAVSEIEGGKIILLEQAPGSAVRSILTAGEKDAKGGKEDEDEKE